jgi:hypothetical protein
MATRRVEDKNRLNFLALRMSAFDAVDGSSTGT